MKKKLLSKKVQLLKQMVQNKRNEQETLNCDDKAPTNENVEKR